MIVIWTKEKVECIGKEATGQELLGQIRPPKCINTGASISEITDISLSIIFKDGPAVSFMGSPVVSTITAAL